MLSPLQWFAPESGFAVNNNADSAPGRTRYPEFSASDWSFTGHCLYRRYLLFVMPFEAARFKIGGDRERLL